VVNRIQKVLEEANIKLAGVASDVMGALGRAMIPGLIAGEADASTLAELAKTRLRRKIPQLQQAFNGRVSEHHQFQLRLLMNQVNELEGWIGELGVRIEGLMSPFAAEAKRLVAISGVGPQAA